jgi:thiamine biosynthesis protein ThiS
MIVTVNGTAKEVPEGTGLAGLLELLDLAEVRVAVEWNGVIVPRERYGETILQPDDRVEIVHFVGGG